MRSKWKRWSTALLTVVVLGACADGPFAESVPSAPSLDVVGIAETMAGPDVSTIGEAAGSCPAGYVLEEKPYPEVDVNKNGLFCYDGKGGYIDDGAAAGTCPEGFKLLMVDPGQRGDANENGVVCYDGREIVDDVLDEPGTDTQFAGGHGNFLPKGQDISFSFHGRHTKETVKGQFEMHDRIGGARIHGEMTCLSVSGNRAQLAGIIRQSTDPFFKVGMLVTWTAQDNGEGAHAPADLISRPSYAGEEPQRCPRKVKLPHESVVDGGNIQVRQ